MPGWVRHGAAGVELLGMDTTVAKGQGDIEARQACYGLEQEAWRGA